jgi:trimeric autotransporter adhesin
MTHSEPLQKRLAVLIALASLNLAAVADQTWKGTTDNLWTNTSNWSGSAIPGSTDLVIYNGTSTGNLSNWLSQAFSIKGILFTNPAGPVSINSSSPFTNGASGIAMTNATQPLTITAPLTLASSQSWVVATNQSLTVSGGVAGAGGLYKDGFGALYLNGPNTFTGSFTNNGGAVWINSSSGLGTGTKSVVIANNNVAAGLHLNGTNGNIALPSTFTWTVSDDKGTIINEAGDNTIAGNMFEYSGGGQAYMVVNGGTLTLNGTFGLSTTPRPFMLGGAGNGTLNGAVNAVGLALRKVDAGTWTLNAANNSYTNYTTIEGGTLALGPNARINATTNITVFANATLDVSMVTNAILGTNDFVLTNQVLAGSGIVTGNVATAASATIQPGSLNVAQTAGGMGVAGTLSLMNNLTLGSTVTNYFELNTATTPGAGVNDLISVGGSLDPQNARIFVTALSAFTTGTPYRLFNYAGSKLSSFNPTVLTDTHYTFTLDETVANQINVTVTGGVNLLWQASASSSVWDFNTTANWNNNTLKFLNFDPVTFDDTAATNFVTLTGTLKPVSVSFTNSALNYTLQGSGKITGPTGLAKAGSGTLTVTTTGSDYTGPVVVNGGVLSVGSVALNGSASSLGAGTNVTLNGGTFRFTGTRPGASTFNRFWTLGPNGGTILSTNGTFFIPNQISGPGSLTKTGSVQIILGDIVSGVLTNANNSYSGGTLVAQGELQARSAHALGTGKAVVANGADLGVGGGGNYGAITNDIDLNGGDGNGSAGTLQVNDGGTAVTFSGTIDLLADSSVGTVNNGNAVTFTIAGPIIGPGALKKLGTNTVSVASAANSYAGGTTVSAGTLDVKADGALGSGNVTVASGATLKLELGTANSYIRSGASLLLGAGTPVVNLAFSGAPNTINALSFDGGATFKAAGTWGSPTSGAAHTDSRFTGNGLLNVLTGPASTTTVASSANPSVYGNAVTFTAAVTPASATGTITFQDGASVLGTAPVSGGQAAFTTNRLLAATSPHAITALYSGDSNYNPSSSSTMVQTVNPATLTITGLVAQGKVYDTTLVATITGTPAPAGVLFSDVVTLNGTASGAFADRTANTNKPVAVAGLSLAGTDAGNYTLAPLTLSATISQAPLTVTGITASNKLYDGTTAATVNTAGVTLSGVLGTDNVTLDTTVASGAFLDPNVGDGKTVVINGLTLGGTDALNYSVTATTTANIRYGLTVAGIEASDKVYDGTTNSMLIVTNAVLVGVQGTDDVTLDTTNAAGAFGDKNVGAGKTVTVNGLAILGADIGKYLLTQPTTNASITALPLTVTAASDSRAYDGTTNSAGTPGITSGALAAGDTAPVWRQTFDSRNAGARTLTPAGTVNDGNGGNNYAVTYATSSGSITALPFTVTAATDSKMYDRTTSSTGVPTITAGTVVAGDTAPAWTQTFDSRNAGARMLTPAGTVNDGNGGNNYAVTYAPASGSITALPVTVTAVTDSKVYDGTTSSTGLPSITAGSVLAGDTAPVWMQTFDSANAGARTLIPAGIVTDGNGGNNYAVTYATASGSITAASSATAVVSSVNPSGPGTNVTFTATVSSSAGVPAGEVVFVANGVPFSTNALVSGSVGASTASLPLGTNTVAAQYAGDGNFLPSTNSLEQVVKVFVTCSQTNSPLAMANNLDGTFTLTFVGTPQAQYYVVATADLAQPGSWTVVAGSTNTVTNTSGLWQFTVTNSTPQRFYRSAAVAPCP